jgi:hypothetical protein
VLIGLGDRFWGNPALIGGFSPSIAHTFRESPITVRETNGEH